MRKWYAEGKDWVEVRNLIKEYHGRENFTDAPQNIAFTVLGLLYGEDFGDSLLKAVNCGYDTDCTAATLGSILGIIGGMDKIPTKWSEPIGSRIVLSPQVKGFPVPNDLEELTQRTVKIAREVLAIWNIPIEIAVASKSKVEENSLDQNGQIVGDYDPRWLWNYSFNTNRYLLPNGTVNPYGMEVILDYGEDGPSIGKNHEKELSFKISNLSQGNWEGNLEIIVPEGFRGPNKQPFKLLPEEINLWKVKFILNGVMKPYYNFRFNINRERDKNIWNTCSIDFTLVASTHWQVCGPEAGEKYDIICPGNRIEFKKAFPNMVKGIYHASTTLKSMKDRKILLICATAAPVKVTLNGEVVIEDNNYTEFMPAYHRAVASKQAEVSVLKGDNILEIEVVNSEDDLNVYIVPAAIWRERCEDTYYHSNILMG